VAPRGTRASAEERREQVIEAALKEFAAHGFHATTTTAIAQRAGISQPYIYALFENKHELFLAVNRQVVDRIRRTFIEAARAGGDPEERLLLMGDSYHQLLTDRDDLLFQLQTHAAVGDPELREPVRTEFMRLFEDVVRMSGAEHLRVVRFMAEGMLLNVVAALELPEEYMPPRPEQVAPAVAGHRAGHASAASEPRRDAAPPAEE
jgi:AcrR family transcriptional regulator